MYQPPSPISWRIWGAAHPTGELQALDLERLTKALGLFGEEHINREPLGYVFQLRPPQGNYRAQHEFLGDFLINHLRDTDSVGLGQGL